MDLNISRRVLITGGASGLGKALAMVFVRAGHRVMIADIHQSRGQDTLQALRSIQSEAAWQHCDVTDTASVQAAVDAAVTAWGGLDVMINNAGIAGGGRSEDEWRRVMEINFYGVWRGCEACLPVFKSQRSGHIVNIASMAGLLNPPGMGAYNVAKAAVVSLSETLQPELAVHGAGLTLVCPSFFPTNLGESLQDRSPMRQDNLQKLMAASELSADDIAACIYQAVSDNQFLLIPHQKATLAYDLKRQSLDEHLLLQQQLAAKQLAAAAKL